MKNLFYVVLSVLMFSFAANAQSFGKMGTIETGGSLSFSSTTEVVNDETADDALSVFSFQPYIGYFFTDGFEVGLIPAFTSASRGDNSESILGIYLAPAYNFMLENSMIYPFIEARVGYTSESSDDGTNDVTNSGLSYGARGGIKAHLSGNSLLNVGLEYMMITLDPEDPPAGADGRYGYNQFAFTVGWTVFFK